MANLSIQGIGQKLTNLANREITFGSTNPFAQGNTKDAIRSSVNMLNADVFESQDKKHSEPSFTGAVPAKSKLIYSTFVGSISNMGSRIHAGIESVAQFGRRIKSSAVDFWNRMQNIEVSLQPLKDALSTNVNSLFERTNKDVKLWSSTASPKAELQPLFADMVAMAEKA